MLSINGRRHFFSRIFRSLFLYIKYFVLTLQPAKKLPLFKVQKLLILTFKNLLQISVIFFCNNPGGFFTTIHNSRSTTPRQILSILFLKCVIIIALKHCYMKNKFIIFCVFFARCENVHPVNAQVNPTFPPFLICTVPNHE